MKKSKMLSAILAIVMLMSTLTTTINAYETQPKAQIVVQNDTDSSGLSIHGKVYNVYTLLDAKVIEATNADGKTEDRIEYNTNEVFYAFFDQFIDDDVTANRDEALNLSSTMTEIQKEQAMNAYNDAVKAYIESYKNDMQTLATSVRTFVVDNGIAFSTQTDNYVKTGSIETVRTDAMNPGYYMVLDKDAVDPVAGTNNHVTAAAMVTLPFRTDGGTLTANVTVYIKGSAPGIEKEIFHDDANKWEVVGDYQIGDKVKFKIKSDIPKDITGYTQYTYFVSDIMSKGLLFNNDAKIFLDDGTDVTNGKLHSSVTPVGKETFRYSFDIIGIKAAFPLLEYFTIEYSATVTEEALVYLNDPANKETNKAILEYSNNPYKQDSTDKIEDDVYGYTFNLDVLKTKGDGVSALAGATFALYEKTMPNVNETVDTQLYLKPVTKDQNDVPYTVPTYVISKEGVASDDSGVIVTDETGKFNIIGLNDAKDYILKEFSAPSGYNPAGPIEFKFTTTYAEDELTGIPVPTLKTVGDIKDNSIVVVNTSAALLPETGGIGTTVFMIIGSSIMVLALGLYVFKSKKAKN